MIFYWVVSPKILKNFTFLWTALKFRSICSYIFYELQIVSFLIMQSKAFYLLKDQCGYTIYINRSFTFIYIVFPIFLQCCNFISLLNLQWANLWVQFSWQFNIQLHLPRIFLRLTSLVQGLLSYCIMWIVKVYIIFTSIV